MNPPSFTKKRPSSRLNGLFQKCFHVGKQVRSATAAAAGAVLLCGFSCGGLSSADLLATSTAPNRRSGRGPGTCQRECARGSQARGAGPILHAFPITLGNKSRGWLRKRAAAPCTSKNGSAKLADLDILVASTSAPPANSHRRHQLSPVLRHRGDRPLFWIDVAVPRDIKPNVHRLNRLRVYDLDALQSMAERSMEARKQEAAGCDGLIAKHVVQFQTWIARSVPPIISTQVMGCLRLDSVNIFTNAPLYHGSQSGGRFCVRLQIMERAGTKRT